MRYHESDSKVRVLEVGEPRIEIIEAPCSGTLYWFKEDNTQVDVGILIGAIVCHLEYNPEKPWEIIRSPARGILRIRIGDGEVQKGHIIAEIEVVLGFPIIEGLQC